MQMQPSSPPKSLENGPKRHTLFRFENMDPAKKEEIVRKQQQVFLVSQKHQLPAHRIRQQAELSEQLRIQAEEAKMRKLREKQMREEEERRADEKIEQQRSANVSLIRCIPNSPQDSTSAADGDRGDNLTITK